MADKKFFLGIGGQQSGPFLEKEVKDKIAAGDVKPDALVWYEGLGEWQRVDTIVYFQSSFKKSKQLVAGESGNSRPEPTQELAKNLRPVFSPEEAVFFRPKGPRPAVLVGGGVVLLVGLVVFLTMGGEESTFRLAHTAKKAAGVTRFGRFQKAESDYLLKPNLVPEDFTALLDENTKDDVGVRSFQALEAIYKKRHALRELGGLYLKVGRPAEAVAPFVEDQNYGEAEKAAFKAYEQAPEKEAKRQFLLKSIELLTTHQGNSQTAIERIQILERDFPGTPHSYGYYLLTPEKKMADLFDRTSFFFVENLINHMKAEFPQLKLGGRPLVSLVKEGADRYRLVGSYRGDVILSHDKLTKIFFEFWLVNNTWNLVSTNITKEREQWSKKNRERGTAASSGAQMLAYLESVMHNQFPRVGVHQRISQEEMTAAAKEGNAAH